MFKFAEVDFTISFGIIILYVVLYLRLVANISFTEFFVRVTVIGRSSLIKMASGVISEESIDLSNTITISPIFTATSVASFKGVVDVTAGGLYLGSFALAEQIKRKCVKEGER